MLFAQIAAQVFVVINLSQETNALTVSALGVDKMLAFGNFAYLILLIMTNGK